MCCKEINYGNKGSHALLAHCKTEINQKKISDITTTHSVASTSTPSTSAVVQGPDKIREKCQERLPTPIVLRIANAEVGRGMAIISTSAASILCHKNTTGFKLILKYLFQAMVLAVLPENSLSFSVAPVIVELAQTLAMDKVALQGIKLSHTVTSYKMVHGQGQTFSERVFSNTRIFPFSLNVDESSSNNNKKVGLIWSNYIALQSLHYGCTLTIFPSQFLN